MCFYTCLRICARVGVYACMHCYIYIYIYIYVCVCVCVCVCVYLFPLSQPKFRKNDIILFMKSMYVYNVCTHKHTQMHTSQAHTPTHIHTDTHTRKHAHTHICIVREKARQTKKKRFLCHFNRRFLMYSFHRNQLENRRIYIYIYIHTHTYTHTHTYIYIYIYIYIIIIISRW